MSALSKRYEKTSASNKVFLMKRLFNMKMSEGGFVADHLNEFITLTTQLSSIKVNFEYEVRALLILCSLPERWNSLVMGVSNLSLVQTLLSLMMLLVLFLVRKCEEKAQVRH